MDLVDKVIRYGPRSRYFSLVGDRTDRTSGSPVQQTLLTPTAIFSGVREHQDGGLCYCGKPTCRYTESGAKVPPVPGMIFLVYINPRNRVFEWRWEKDDPTAPGLPVGWDDPARFKEKLWPK